MTNPGGGPTHGDIDVDGGGLGLVHSAAHLAGGWLDNRLTYSAGLTYLNETRGVENGTADRNWAGQGYLGYTPTPNMKLSVRVLADSGYLQLQNSPSPATNVTPPADGIIPAIGLSRQPIAARQSRRLDLSIKAMPPSSLASTCPTRARIPHSAPACSAGNTRVRPCSRGTSIISLSKPIATI